MLAFWFLHVAFDPNQFLPTTHYDGVITYCTVLPWTLCIDRLTAFVRSEVQSQGNTCQLPTRCRGAWCTFYHVITYVTFNSICYWIKHKYHGILKCIIYGNLRPLLQISKATSHSWWPGAVHPKKIDHMYSHTSKINIWMIYTCIYAYRVTSQRMRASQLIWQCPWLFVLTGHVSADLAVTLSMSFLGSCFV